MVLWLMFTVAIWTAAIGVPLALLVDRFGSRCGWLSWPAYGATYWFLFMHNTTCLSGALGSCDQCPHQTIWRTACESDSANPYAILVFTAMWWFCVCLSFTLGPVEDRYIDVR